ncbi:MAG: ribosomal-protein-alanine N-acetyltransferase [Ruminococcaceae bacterium]|nr:ribosomal-protein-alanine N-acetyltransferase [Oscillospiraceae bacterium]
MKIVDATPDMIPEIIEIESSSFSVPWSEKSFTDALNSERISVRVAVDESGTVLGFICFLIIDEEAELLNIAVSLRSRNKGIGSSLLEYMMDVMNSADVKRVFLEVRESNIPARYLYEKFGFAIIGKRKNYYSNPTENAILMQKNIIS